MSGQENIEDQVEYADQEDLDELAGYDPTFSEEARRHEEYINEQEVETETELDKLATRKVEANQRLSNNEISLAVYNEEIIDIQREIAQIKLRKLSEEVEVADLRELRNKTDKLLRDIQAQSTGQLVKLNPDLIYNDIDKIFQNSGKLLETVNKDAFISREVESNISNVLSVPISDRNVQRLRELYEAFERDPNINLQKEYLNVKEFVVIHQATSRYSNDILFYQFMIDLRMMFAQLRNFLYKGVNHELLTPQAIDQQVIDLANKYQSRKSRLFSGGVEETEDVKRFMKKLAEIQVIDEREEVPTFKPKFTREEIHKDFEKGDPEFLNRKYAKYQDKFTFVRDRMNVTTLDENFGETWMRIPTPTQYRITGDGVETAIHPLPIFNQSAKMGKDGTFTDIELKSLKRNRAINNALAKAFEVLDKGTAYEMFKSCVNKLNIRDPDYEATRAEQFIMELYENNIPIFKHSQASDTLRQYAESVNKMADEFYLNKTLLKSSWNQGIIFTEGEKVVVSQHNKKVNQLRKAIYKLENQLLTQLFKTKENEKAQELLRKKTAELELLEKKGEKVVVSQHNEKVNQLRKDIYKLKNQLLKQLLETEANEKLLRKKTAELELLEKEGLRKQDYNAIFINFEKDKQYAKVKMGDVVKSVPVTAISRLLYKNKRNAGGPFGMIGLKTRGDQEMKKDWKERKSKFEYPPEFPIINQNEDFDLSGYDPYEMMEYWIKVKKNPEINPFVELYTPIPNELYERLKKKSYSDLYKAIQDTEIGGFFHLTGGDPASQMFQIIDQMSPKEQSRLLYILNPSIEETTTLVGYLFGDLLSEKHDVIVRTRDEKGRVVPIIKNPKFEEILNEVGYLTKFDLDLIDRLNYIDRSLNPKLVNNKSVQITLKNKRVEYNDLNELKEDLTNHIHKNLEWIPSINQRTQIKFNPETKQEELAEEYLTTVMWNSNFNPTFQVVPLEKQYSDSIVISHEGDRYRIRFAQPSGEAYKGWLIREKGFKYPLIVTDFKEYLRKLRDNYESRIHYYLQFENITDSVYPVTKQFQKKIDYITEYLQDDYEFTHQTNDLRISGLKHITDALRILNDKNISDDVISDKAHKLEQHIVLISKQNLSFYKNAITNLINYLMNDINANNDLMSGKLSIIDVINKSYGSPKRSKILKGGPSTYALKVLKKQIGKEEFDNLVLYFSNMEVLDPKKLLGIYKLTTLMEQAVIIELMNKRMWDEAMDKIQSVKPNESVKNAYLMKVSRRIWTSLPNISFEKRIQRAEHLEKQYKISKFLASDLEGAIFNLSEGSEEEYDKQFKNIKFEPIVERMEGGLVDPISIVAMIVGVLERSQNWEQFMKRIEHDPRVMKGIQKTINSAQVYRKLDDLKVRAATEENLQKDKEKYWVKDEVTGELIKRTEAKVLKLTEEQKRSAVLMNILRYDYQPRVWDAIQADLQDAISDEQYKESIRQIRKSQGATDEEILQSMRDIDRLKLSELSYDELRNLNELVYQPPSLLSKIPVDLAIYGVNVCPTPERGMFLVGGKFPLDARAYRFRNSQGNLDTKLVDVCKMMGKDHPTVDYPVDVSIYTPKIFDFEKSMMECVKSIRMRNFLFKINNDRTVHPEYLQMLCKNMGISDRIMNQAKIYWEKHGGDRLVFPNGGTKKEFEQLLGAMMYDSCVANIIGGPPSPLFAQLRTKKQNLLLTRRNLLEKLQSSKEPAKLNKQIKQIDEEIAKIDKTDKKPKMMDVSILHTKGGDVIYRQIHHDKVYNYPVPTDYDYNGFPVYTFDQIGHLKWIIDNGLMSSWLVNRVKITINDNGQFTIEGNAPFNVVPKKTNNQISHYYVEQTFRDDVYGMPIVCRIGIIPKQLNAVRQKLIEDIKMINVLIQQKSVKDEEIGTKDLEEERDFLINTLNTLHLKENIVHQMPAPVETFVTNNEKKRLEYYLNQKQSVNVQQPISVEQNEFFDKGGYALLDHRSVVGIQGLKYDPVDVWSWDPLKDHKARAQTDANVWKAEKNRMVKLLKEQLQKTGSSSSAFIALKNNLTQRLEHFRLNLPSQQLKAAKYVSKKAKPRKFMMPDEVIRKLKTDAQFRKSMNIQSWIMSLNITDTRAEYARQSVLLGLVKIPSKFYNIIKDPRILFPNYNRASVYIYEWEQNPNNYQLTSAKKYLSDEGKFGKQKNTPDVWETIGEIIYNMSFTRYLTFPDKVQEQVNNNFSELTELRAGLRKNPDYKTKYINLMNSYPILEILYKLYKENKPLTLWNVLVKVLDTWYYTKEELDKTYIFEEPIEITMYDIVCYLGDSYQQNYSYKHQSRVKEKDIYWLYPGCIYRKIQQMDNITPPNEYGVSSLEENHYIKVYEIPETVERHFEMFVVGNELHKESDVSDNLARRAALVFNVDISDLMACAGSNAKRLLGQGRTKYALDLNDVKTYLEKGGNYYTYYEMPNEEIDLMLKEGVIIRANYEAIKAKKKEYIDIYRKALTTYFEDGLDAIENIAGIEAITLNKLIDQAVKVKESGSSIRKFIDTLDFTPDFKDASWPSKLNEIKYNFLEKVGIPLESILNNSAKSLYLNVPSYDSLPDPIVRERVKVEKFANLKNVKKMIKDIEGADKKVRDLVEKHVPLTELKRFHSRRRNRKQRRRSNKKRKSRKKSKKHKSKKR